MRFGLVDGKLIFNPTSDERKVSDLDVTVVSTGKKVVMRERIRQIESKALRKLRHPSRSKKLRDFLN